MKQNDFNESTLDSAKVEETTKTDILDKIFKPVTTKGKLDQRVDLAFANASVQAYEDLYNPKGKNPDAALVKKAFTKSIKFNGRNLTEWLIGVSELEGYEAIDIVFGVYDETNVRSAAGIDATVKDQLINKGLPRLTVFLYPVDANGSILKDLQGKQPYNLGHINP